MEQSKMKPVDVNSGKYTDFAVENNDKDPTLKVGDHVKISKSLHSKLVSIIFYQYKN